MSLFTNPHKVLDNLKDWIIGESQDVIDFLRPVAKMLERDGRKALIVAATAAVAEMAHTDLTNADKRDQALHIIETSLIAAGTQFVESEARVAIELAYQSLLAKGA